MDYKPKPIDTTGTEIDPGLLKLTEKLAENAHDTWARQRMDEGWTWGPKRDDATKKNPNLVPYHDLTESEKEYDRSMAMETLKVLLRLGYRIERGEDATAGSDSDDPR